MGSCRFFDVTAPTVAPRAAASTAASRTEPSSIHTSVVRSSICWRSIEGSRGSRGGRRAFTSRARFSASVRGRLGRVERLSPPPREPRSSRLRLFLREPPRRSSDRLLPRLPPERLPPERSLLERPPPERMLFERPLPPDGRDDGDDDSRDMGRHATSGLAERLENEQTHRRQYPGGAFVDRNPATSYSPRGSLPKYHRR